MNYEIVELQEKKVAGLKVRTNNGSPDMGEKIGGLWQRFFEEGIFFTIPGKVDEKSIGLYTNYAGDEKSDYDVYVCCEVAVEIQLPEILCTTVIPGGKYARFIVNGHMQTAVQEFWTQLWGMKLDRKFSCDFEEYQPGKTAENSEIHMYISLN